VRHETEPKPILNFGVDSNAILSGKVALGGDEALIVLASVDCQAKLEPLPRRTNKAKADVRIGCHRLAQLMESINIVYVDLHQAGMSGWRLAVGACAAHCERRQRALGYVVLMRVDASDLPQSANRLRVRAALDLVKNGVNGHVAVALCPHVVE
jgi:hypothetical protein